MVILSHHEQQTALKIVALVALVALVSVVTGTSHISFTCGREARAEASPACTFIYDAACGSLREGSHIFETSCMLTDAKT